MLNEIRQQLISNTSSRPHTLNFTEGLLPDKPTPAHTLLDFQSCRHTCWLKNCWMPFLNEHIYYPGLNLEK